MTPTPVVSIIVPVYNAEKFIHRCIDSILAQTFTDWELLLIDDGSKDASGKICDEYAAKDERIRVFHKENGGVSSARNLGLDHARGEWITFVDADDYIEENFLKSFEGNLDADIVVGNMYVKRKNSEENVLSGILSGYNCSIKSVISGNLTRFVFQSSNGKLFKASLLQGLRFDEQMVIGEDCLFLHSYMCRAKDIRVLIECKELSCYIYIPPESMKKKYQISVSSSIYHIQRLDDVYSRLGTFDKDFEVILVWGYYEFCVNDMPYHGELWYKNKEIERICLRRSAHGGIIPWIKTWLSFHVFYRLKMHYAKKYKY